MVESGYATIDPPAMATTSSRARAPKTKTKATPDRLLNRELSWLDFNGRVLELAADPSVPLLERVKFCSIFAANLDEFFMIRVGGLIGQAESGLSDPSPDGRTPQQALAEIRERVRRARRRPVARVVEGAAARPRRGRDRDRPGRRLRSRRAGRAARAASNQRCIRCSRRSRSGRASRSPTSRGSRSASVSSCASPRPGRSASRASRCRRASRASSRSASAACGSRSRA